MIGRGIGWGTVLVAGLVAKKSADDIGGALAVVPVDEAAGEGAGDDALDADEALAGLAMTV